MQGENGPVEAGSRAGGRHAVVALLTAALPLVAWTQFTPFYQTNDDVAIRLLAEGRFVPGGQPVEFLLFINVLVGKLLVLGYRLLPGLPWYDLLMLASTALAAGALSAVWVSDGEWRTLIWGCLLAGFFLLPLFIVLQFSLVGTTSAVAGFSLLTRAAVEPLAERSSRMHRWLGAGLFVWGGLIRAEGALLTVLLGCALALPLAIAGGRDAEGRRRLHEAAIALGIAVALFGLASMVDSASYARRSGWRDYPAYNRARLNLTEYAAFAHPTSRTLAALRNRVGWSDNDLAMLRHWFFTDARLFSLEQLQEAARVLYPRGRVASVGQRIDLVRCRAIARRFLAGNGVPFMLLATFVVAQGGRRPSLHLYFLGASSIVLLFAVAIELALKAAPSRVFWPMLILEASLLVLAARRWGRSLHPALTISLTLCAGLVLVRSFPPLGQERLPSNRAAAVRDVAGLKRSGAELYVMHASTFPFEVYWRPFWNDTGLPILAVGVSAQTPPIQEFLRRTGRSDLVLSLCTEPGLLLIAGADVLPTLASFVREHHGLEASFKPAFRGELFTAWACRTHSSPADAKEAH